MVALLERLKVMNEVGGKVFSIAKENQSVNGCTISKVVVSGEENELLYFSLAAQTGISAESYLRPKVLVVLEGSLLLKSGDNEWNIEKDHSIVTPVEVPVSLYSETGCVYMEISSGGKENMNSIIQDGNVFALKDLIPYQDGKIINMDLIDDSHMKYVVMSFDAGTGLSEHAAPGEALLLGLDGEGVIGYEGKEYILHEGESFKFAKNGRHYVKANGKFKMALLIVLE